MNTKLKELIESKYGSIDKMIEITETTMSRAYFYQLVNGINTNPSKNILRELSRVLEVSLEDVLELIDEAKEV